MGLTTEALSDPCTDDLLACLAAADADAMPRTVLHVQSVSRILAAVSTHAVRVAGASVTACACSPSTPFHLLPWHLVPERLCRHCQVAGASDAACAAVCQRTMPAVLAAAQKQAAHTNSAPLCVLALRTANAIVSAVLRSTTERGASADGLRVTSTWHGISAACTQTRFIAAMSPLQTEGMSISTLLTQISPLSRHTAETCCKPVLQLCSLQTAAVRLQCRSSHHQTCFRWDCTPRNSRHMCRKPSSAEAYRLLLV